ncbi:MAG: class I mannose-6-phosphate isomerase [Deltaproteobacteria bacterium]|nr:class I mannose-6-phosphate isomerase [Deltaproteobacteria bacterium]
MIRFLPIYKQTIWGHNRFAVEFNRTLPSEKIGESWELVELEGNESQVANGPHEGKGLGELWRSGIFGGSAQGKFPFMVKWIDTHQKLSVQVHPDDAACKKLGFGQPKSEAFYIAEVDAGAFLLLGHYPGLDAATLRQASSGGTISKWLYEVMPRVGDIITVPAGTLHCLGAGLLTLEVGQPSATTFRVYDWDRTDAMGKMRHLAIEEACVSVNFPHSQVPKAEREGALGPTFRMQPLRVGIEVGGDNLRVFVADSGPAKLTHLRGEEILEYGDLVVAEVAEGPVRVASGTAVLISEP